MIRSRPPVRPRVAAVCLAVALAVTPALAGCSDATGTAAAEGPASGAAAAATSGVAPDPGGAGDANADRPDSGSPVVGLPDGFPGEIPLPDLPIASAAALTTTRGWIVNFRTDDGAAAMDAAHSMLGDAGYQDMYWSADTGAGQVTGESYKVQVLLSDSNPWISFVVRPAEA